MLRKDLPIRSNLMDGGTGIPSTITVYANPIVSKIRSNLLSDSGGITTPEPLTESPWTPSVLSTDLWLDASVSGSVVLSGGVISQWLDLSGNNRHLTQSITSARPNYLSNQLNGLHAVDFDGTDDRLVASQSIFSSNTNFAYLVVAKADDTNTRILFSERIENDSATVFFANVNGSGIFYRRGGVTTSTVADIIENITIPTTPQIFGLNTTATLGDAYRNGNLIGSDTTTINGFTLRNFLLGANYVVSGSGTQQHWNGQVYELLVFPNNLDLSDFQKVEGYLAHKWGLTANLPSGHPYKSSPPTLFS